MISFLVELGHFLLAVWGRTYRWALYRKRNLIVGFSIVVTAAIVFSVVSHTINDAGTDPRRLVATATPSPTPTERYTEVQASAVPTSGSAPAATQTPGEATRDPEHPKKPQIDADDPESVAKGWAVGYLSRPDAEWDKWRSWLRPYLTDQVSEQLVEPVEGTAEDQVLEAAPTRVTGVTVSAPQEDADTNTPVRWSHTLTVSVKTDDGTVELLYGVAAEKGDDGWVITTVQQLGTAQGE